MAEHASRPAGVNGSFLVSSLTGLAAFYFWPGPDSVIQQHIGAWALSAVSLTSLIAGTRALASDIGVRKKLLDAEKPSTEYGSAREATEKELEARGVFDPSSGTFLGFVFGRAAFVPRDIPFSMIEAPPGSGKDIFFVTGDVLHHSLLGHSVLVVDIKPETGPMLAPGLREAGVEVWCVNPTKMHFEACGDVELGLYQSVIDAVHGDAANQKDAVGLAQNLAKLHLPDSDIDKSKLYFVGGTRRAISTVALTLAIIDPTRCHPGGVFETLNDTGRFIRFLKAIITELEPIGSDERLIAFIKSEAQNLLSRSETNAENFGAFLEWATQVLGPSFNQAGHLATYGEQATQNVKSLRERPITMFIMTPHSHKEEFRAFTSITNDNLLSACKRNQTGQRVHCVFNEALAYDFSDLPGDLQTMRGMGMTANIYAQSYNGLVRKLGKDAAAAVNDYCDCKVYFGINSYDRAKAISDMLSETTINSMDYSHKTTPDDLNISHKRHARSLMTPDEIMTMRDEAWVSIKGTRPFRAKLTHYGQADPWKRLVQASPQEGAPLQGKTLLKINYPERT